MIVLSPTTLSPSDISGPSSVDVVKEVVACESIDGCVTTVEASPSSILELRSSKSMRDVVVESDRLESGSCERILPCSNNCVGLLVAVTFKLVGCLVCEGCGVSFRGI